MVEWLQSWWFVASLTRTPQQTVETLEMWVELDCHSFIHSASHVGLTLTRVGGSTRSQWSTWSHHSAQVFVQRGEWRGGGSTLENTEQHTQGSWSTNPGPAPPRSIESSSFHKGCRFIICQILTFLGLQMFEFTSELHLLVLVLLLLLIHLWPPTLQILSLKQCLCQDGAGGSRYVCRALICCSQGAVRLHLTYREPGSIMGIICPGAICVTLI